MQQVAGTYEGEGPNTTAAIAGVPDINAAPSGSTENAANMADTALKAKGRTASVAITRRRQLRVSTEGARAGVAINVGAADQVLANAGRAVYVSVTGDIVCRLVDDTADTTWSNLAVGWHPLAIAIVRKAGTTASGNIAF